MSEKNFKSITEVTTVDNLPKGANVIINDGGVAKQVSLEKLISDIMAKERFVVNITIAPNGDGNPYSIHADKTYEELKDAYDNGKDIIFAIKEIVSDGTCIYESKINHYEYANVSYYSNGMYGNYGFIVSYDGGISMFILSDSCLDWYNH